MKLERPKITDGFPHDVFHEAGQVQIRYGLMLEPKQEPSRPSQAPLTDSGQPPPLDKGGEGTQVEKDGEQHQIGNQQEWETFADERGTDLVGVKPSGEVLDGLEHLLEFEAGVFVRVLDMRGL